MNRRLVAAKLVDWLNRQDRPSSPVLPHPALLPFFGHPDGLHQGGQADDARGTCISCPAPTAKKAR